MYNKMEIDNIRKTLIEIAEKYYIKKLLYLVQEPTE